MSLRKMSSIVAAMMVVGLSSNSAGAQTPPYAASTEACVPNAPVTTGAFDFFLGITPSDSPMDVWCRIQKLSGDYRLTTYFPEVNIFKTATITFDGTAHRSKEEFAKFIQGFLPQSDEAPDPEINGSAVLGRVVQGVASKTPDGEILALPPTYENAKRIALWQPLYINLRGYRMPGVNLDFDISVEFVPTAARFVAGVEGRMENVVIRGWREDVLKNMTIGSADCSEFVPDCHDMPSVIPLDTAWVLRKVALVAKGERLSGPARTLLTSVAAKAKEPSNVMSTMSAFKDEIGDGEVKVQVGARTITARAEGAQDGRGTLYISLVYADDMVSDNSFARFLNEYSSEVRSREILKAPTQAQ